MLRVQAGIFHVVERGDCLILDPSETYVFSVGDGGFNVGATVAKIRLSPLIRVDSVQFLSSEQAVTKCVGDATDGYVGLTAATVVKFSYSPFARVDSTNCPGAGLCMAASPVAPSCTSAPMKRRTAT